MLDQRQASPPAINCHGPTTGRTQPGVRRARVTTCHQEQSKGSCDSRCQPFGPSDSVTMATAAPVQMRPDLASKADRWPVFMPGRLQFAERSSARLSKCPPASFQVAMYGEQYPHKNAQPDRRPWSPTSLGFKVPPGAAADLTPMMMVPNFELGKESAASPVTSAALLLMHSARKPHWPIPRQGQHPAYNRLQAIASR